MFGAIQLAANAINGRPLDEGMGQSLLLGAAAGATLGAAAPEATAAFAARITPLLLGSAPVAAGAAGQVLKGRLSDAVPANLPQQLALNAARSGGGREIMRDLADTPRLAANYGQGTWVKMQSVLRGAQGNITVHWFRNAETGQNVEYKFAHIADAYK